MSRTRVASKPAGGATSIRAAAAGIETFPAWVVPVVYAIITIVLFREFFFAGGRLLGVDTYALSYFARNFYTETVSAGQFPLWNPYLFGGIPFVEGMHGDIFYPLSLALFFLDARTMWGWKMVLHVFLAGVFTYLWLRGIGLRRAPAFFGGLVYMMGADLVSLVFPGGDGKLMVSALAPLMFLLTERAVSRGRAADYAFFSLGLALVVFTSHMQLAYFTVWGVSLYFMFRVVQQWREHRRAPRAAAAVGKFALAGLLGMGAAAVQFVPPLEYLREWSHRAERAEGRYTFATSWSIHPEEAVSLVVPEFVGDNAATEVREGNTYWGRNAFKLNHEYAGVIPLLLIPVLLIGRRDPRALFFMALAVLAVLYALGANTPAFRIFYLIPGVNLFRSPSLIIFLYGLSIATLGALGVQRLLDWARAGGREVLVARKALWIVAGVFGLLALLASAGAIIDVWRTVFSVAPDGEAALQANLENIRLGFWVTFILALAVAGTWELLWRGLLAPRGAIVLFALLAAFDLYRVDRPFIRATVLMGESPRDPALFEADESIRFLQARSREEVFRVFNGPIRATPTQGIPAAYDHNVLAAHGLEQIAGHHGNEIGRYRSLIGGDSVENFSMHLLSFLNVEYMVLPQRVQGEGIEEIFVGSRSAVYRNLNALPRAFLVGRSEIVPDDQVVSRMLDSTFDARTVVLLPEPAPGIEIQPDPQGTVEWVNRGLDDATLRVTTDRPALLVITDNYFPAWKARMDNAELAVLRANYAFRAVPVPAGEHTIHLYYDSRTLRASAATSVALLLLLIAAGAGGTLRARAVKVRE